MNNLRKRFDTELDSQQKIVVVLLIATALVALVMLIGFISPTIFQGLRSVFARKDPAWVYGNASEYLPAVGELPAGFRLVDSESGPIPLDYASFHRSTFIYPEQEQQQREGKVLYSVGVYKNIEIATDAFKNFGDPDYYSGNTSSKIFPLVNFSNVDSVAMLLTQDMNTSGDLTIAYTLVFRYRNFTASVTAIAPVLDYYDEYAMQMQSRLKNAVIYYASLVINRLPVDQISSVPQPPFGVFMISTKSIVVEPTRQLLLEATFTPGP